MATHKISLTLNEPLEKRFQSKLETGMKKASVIAQSLDETLPKSKRTKKSK